ncbi:MAG: YCF48-related protein [Chthoniobacterales bacterium]
MARFRLMLLTVLICSLGTVVHGQVSLLRSDDAPVPRPERGQMAPLLDEWVRQAPLPTARNLSGVAWATATHAFASGDVLTLVETLDGGITWSDVDLPGSSTGPLYNVSCVDANICVAIGNSATTGPDIYRTSNAGVSWQQVTAFPVGGSWYHIDFVSPTVGFMGSNGATVRTEDAGATWQIRSAYPSCPVMYGMDFRDTLVGLCGGDRVSTTDGGPGIFKTSDGGVTWVRKFSQAANDVLWLNDTTALAIVGVSIYRSTNSGDTWSQISSQIFTGLDEMVVLPNGMIVGVSLAGDGWRSIDGGFNWTRTLVGVGGLPASWNVSFFDDQIGAIVGQGGYFFKTTDGGLTWTPLNSGIGGVEFHDLEMFDDATGLAVGDNGYYLRTTNGGDYWAVGRLQVTGVTLFRDESLQAVGIVDQDFAVAAGNNGVVYKTFDRGATWQSIGYPILPDDYYITDVKFIDRNVGYVAGTRPGVAILAYRTTDGGATWTALNTLPSHFVDFVDPSYGWLATIGGTGFRTTNGGATWTAMTFPNNGSSPILSHMDFISQNVGWVVGWFGYAARTSNGGASWTLQNISTPDEILLGLSVLSETEAYAVGVRQQPTSETASLYHTVDGGTTWTRSFLPADFLNNVFAAPSGNIWTSGYDGTVLFKAGSSSALQLVSAVSRKTHRTAGTFDISLPLTGTAGVECRDGGGSYSFVFNFTTNVISGSASITSGTGTASTPTFSGTTMTVPLTGVADVQTLTVTLTGVTDSSSQVLPATPVSATMLIGDINADKTVNTTDVSLVRVQVGMAVTSANFRDDARISGTITSGDVKLVKGANGHTVP